MIKINIQDIIFLDIETVSQLSSFEELSKNMQKLWEKKSQYFATNESSPKIIYQEKAGIYAEFGKVICISIGYISFNGNEKIYRIKSLAGNNEKKILTDFKSILLRFCEKGVKTLCAHNGKEFDFPYLIRRMLINRIDLPPILQVFGKKPWEVPFLDTMEMWKFGDYKNYTSLELLSTIFDLPSPKDDIDGSMIGHIYWADKDLDRIVKYCKKDTLAVAQLLLRYLGKYAISEKNIEYIK